MRWLKIRIKVGKVNKYKDVHFMLHKIKSKDLTFHKGIKSDLGFHGFVG